MIVHRPGIEVAAGLAQYAALSARLLPDLRAEPRALRRRGEQAPA